MKKKAIAVCSCFRQCYTVEEFLQHDQQIEQYKTHAVHRWVFVEDLIIFKEKK